MTGSDPEADPSGELPGLLRDLAASLEHARRYHKTAYGSARPVAWGEPVHGAADDATSPATEVAASPSPTPPPLESRRESVDDVRRRVVRNQANAWTPQRKLEYLREKNIGDCQRCRLCEGRRNIVFGVGDARARVMFVGEAPGAEEDRRGEPFVGAAGRRLDAWIEALGLRRSDVYIANVIKCRPPGNRDPRPDEIARCSPFLHAQLRAIEPDVIVALGRFAGAQMIGREEKLYRMRGTIHTYVEPKSSRRIPVVVTYHPSYVLRRESERQADGPADGKSENERVLDDLRAALAAIERERSP